MIQSLSKLVRWILISSAGLSCIGLYMRRVVSLPRMEVSVRWNLLVIGIWNGEIIPWIIFPFKFQKTIVSPAKYQNHFYQICLICLLKVNQSFIALLSSCLAPFWKISFILPCNSSGSAGFYRQETFTLVSRSLAQKQCTECVNDSCPFPFTNRKCLAFFFPVRTKKKNTRIHD